MDAPGLGPELSELVLQGVYLGSLSGSVAAFVSFINLCVLSGKEFICWAFRPLHCIGKI